MMQNDAPCNTVNRYVVDTGMKMVVMVRTILITTTVLRMGFDWCSATPLLSSLTLQIAAASQLDIRPLNLWIRTSPRHGDNACAGHLYHKFELIHDHS